MVKSQLAKPVRFNVSISAQKISKFLLFVVVALHLIYLIFAVLQNINPDSILTKIVLKLFNVDGEGNIPALYSVATLLICAILLGVISSLKKYARDSYFFYWVGLSLVFVLLAWDEAVEIHEKLLDAPVLYQALDSLGLERSGALTFAWVLAAIPVVIIFLLVYLKLFFSLPRQQQKIFAIAAFLYVGGAIGMEMIGGLVVGDPSQIETYKQSSIIYILSLSFEEFLEMSGIVLAIYGLILYINYLLEEMTITIKIKK